MIISRCLVMGLLIVALSSPYVVQRRIVKGNPSLTILVDNSTSFDLFNRGVAFDLKNKLEGRLPVRLNIIGSATKSSIGDALLNYMQGDDNVLLVSDGNSNYGRDLNEMFLFAKRLNSTVSMLNIKPERNDAAVSIIGPHISNRGAENTFLVVVDVAQSPLQYRLKLKIDGELVLDESGDKDKEFRIIEKFEDGVHEMVAEIEVEDYFELNNIFYKTIEVVPKPKILFVSKKTSPMQKLLNELYDVDVAKQIPSDLNKYYSVILNDIPASDVEPQVDMLIDYVNEGNGLIVIGGENSYDAGKYKDSIFELMLPVVSLEKAVARDEQQNVVILMDTSSGSITLEESGLEGEFKFGTPNTDVRKALVMDMVDKFNDGNNLAVLKFSRDADVISPMSRLGEKDIEKLADEVGRQRAAGGSNIHKGIRKAAELLKPFEYGVIIIVTDCDVTSMGVFNVLDQTVKEAQEAKKQGITTHVLGMGESRVLAEGAFVHGTVVRKCHKIVKAGGGFFIPLKNHNRVNVIYGGEEEEEVGYSFQTVDEEHFITSNLDINARTMGYNFVKPRETAQVIVTTQYNDPLVTVWRMGLGRILAFTTDDGTKWSGKLLGKKNSALISRIVNWGIGNPKRNSEFYVDASDSSVGEESTIIVKSNKFPDIEGFKFIKFDDDLYRTTFKPDKRGFVDLFNSKVGVNYNMEFSRVGVHEELSQLVRYTGGEIFDPNNIDKIVESIKQMSKKVKHQTVPLSPYILMAVLAIYLVEVCIRRVIDNIKQRRG